MSQFVRQTVEFLVLNTVGRNPESTDEIIIGTSIGRAIERIVHHHHHLISVAFAPRQRELQGVTEEMVESLHLGLQVAQVKLHRVSFE